jgi:hypothetical protein
MIIVRLIIKVLMIKLLLYVKNMENLNSYHILILILVAVLVVEKQIKEIKI